MKQKIEPLMTESLQENEILSGIALKISHLFSMKEKQRQTLGDFMNSEVLSFNSPSDSVARYDLTYGLGIIGSFSGCVVLNLDQNLAEQIAKNLFDSADAVPEEDVHAAMQELLNIFGGHLATAFNELDIDVDITTPQRMTEDFRKTRDGRRILFRFIKNGSILQFMVALKPQTMGSENE